MGTEPNDVALPGDRPPPNWRRRHLLSIPAWLVVVGLLAIVVARILFFDRTRFLMLADAFTLWIYLPAYLIVVAALCFRLWILAAVAGIVVIAHLVLVIPPLFDTVDVPAAAESAPRIRVVSANLEYTNSDRALLEDLAAMDADVLMLQEVTPEWWYAIVRQGLLVSHPYHGEAIHPGASGMALLSQYPLTNLRIANPDDQPTISATVTIEGRPLQLVDVHPVAPVDTFDRNQAQQRRITAIVRALPKPRIVAGDFNSTMYNAWMGDLTGLGLMEAHEAVGRPFATTWPNGERLVPPLRIDHVLVDPPLLPLRAEEGNGQGSDHRPVIVDLAVSADARR